MIEEVTINARPFMSDSPMCMAAKCGSTASGIKTADR